MINRAACRCFCHDEMLGSMFTHFIPCCYPDDYFDVEIGTFILIEEADDGSDSA